MNQRGNTTHHFLVRLEQPLDESHTVVLPEAAAAGLERGSRLLFFETREADGNAKGTLTGWGEIERLAAENALVSVQLREFSPLRPRVPFSDLRSDPRRDREAICQPITPEVFNTAMSKSRR